MNVNCHQLLHRNFNYLGDVGLGFDSGRARASQILLANELPIDSITERSSDLKTEVHNFLV